MKQQKKQEDKKIQTLSTGRAKPEARPYDYLEPVEEKVLRMRFGLSEEDDKELEYAVGASEDSKLRVGLMEAGNIAQLEGECPLATGADKDVLLTLVSKV